MQLEVGLRARGSAMRVEHVSELLVRAYAQMNVSV
jgi:hypothetical protein